MEELGTAVTSANALHKGDQGAHTPSSEIASHGHLHQGPPISLHPEQLPLARAACRLASHPGISHPPSQLHKRCRWRRIRVAGYAPVGRTAANLHGASLLRAEGDFSPFSNYVPSHVDPPPPIPTVPPSSLGLLLQPYLQPCLCRSPGAASSPARRAGRRASRCTHCLARALSLPLPVDYRVH